MDGACERDGAGVCVCAGCGVEFELVCPALAGCAGCAGAVASLAMLARSFRIATLIFYFTRGGSLKTACPAVKLVAAVGFEPTTSG